MSALTPKADIAGLQFDVRFGPKADMKESRNCRASEFVLGLRQGVLFDLSQCTGRETIVCVRRID
jgi:hypothetical protein